MSNEKKQASTYYYRLFRVKRKDGSVTSVSMDPVLITRACQKLSGLRVVSALIREFAEEYEKEMHRSCSGYVSVRLMELLRCPEDYRSEAIIRIKSRDRKRVEVPDAISLSKNSDASSAVSRHLCKCFSPQERPSWEDIHELGVDEDAWEISHMRCADCGTYWGNAYMAYDGFIDRGRHYRAPITKKYAMGLSKETAVAFFESCNFRIQTENSSEECGLLNVGPSRLVSLNKERQG